MNVTPCALHEASVTTAVVAVREEEVAAVKAAGYEYINVDGGWWGGSDTGHIQRNASGYFEYNKEKYPHGVRAVSDYIHKLGFKYGHYTDAGKHACNRDAPMSEGYEHQDAFLFARELRAGGPAAPNPSYEEAWRVSITVIVQDLRNMRAVLSGV